MIVVVAVSLTGGCTFKPRLIEPELGVVFDLPIGRDAEVKGEDLRLTFEEVTSDSRCPLSVECIWAGEAVYSVLFKKDGTSRTVVFTELGLGGQGEANFLDYTITALLQPYPNQPDDIDPEDYLLRMTVNK
ncbi:MAG: hypothetical protein MUO19_03565 [Dehalococcoidales bacterium]|nr:hypothetical protein [Dehalococcoidales bacterium]